MVTLEHIEASRAHLRPRAPDAVTVDPAAVIVQSVGLDEPPRRRVARLADPIKRLIAWIWSTHRARCAVRELMERDERLLADMGLSRGQLAYAVRHGRERGK